jgi:hypothetical protein
MLFSRLHRSKMTRAPLVCRPIARWAKLLVMSKANFLAADSRSINMHIFTWVIVLRLNFLRVKAYRNVTLHRSEIMPVVIQLDNFNVVPLN